MKPLALQSPSELLDALTEATNKLRADLLQLPSDREHYTEWMWVHADEAAQIAEWIRDHHEEIAAERMGLPSIDDGPLPAPVDTYGADRSIDPNPMFVPQQPDGDWWK